MNRPQATVLALFLLAVGGSTACGDDGTSAAGTGGAASGAGGASSVGGGQAASSASGDGGGSASSGASSSTSSVAATSSNASSSTTTATSTSTATTGGGDEATLSLSFGGSCAPDFAGDLVVASNADSIAITRVDGTFASIQFDLHQTSGTIQLSTAQRVATGDVVNLILDTTWTNISTQEPDPIAGSIVVSDYQEQAGIVDLELVGVVLQNPSTGTLCTVDGTIVTTGTSF